MTLETILNDVMKTLLENNVKKVVPEYDDEFETYYLSWNNGTENYVNLTISEDGVFYFSGLKRSGVWHHKEPIPNALLKGINYEKH